MFSLNITPAQFHAIESLAGDCEGMIGGGDALPDEQWYECVKEIKTMLNQRLSAKILQASEKQLESLDSLMCDCEQMLGGGDEVPDKKWTKNINLIKRLFVINNIEFT
jgi:hypothetical protein